MMLASSCLSHPLTPSSFPPRKSAKSAGGHSREVWGMHAWGWGWNLQFFPYSCMVLFLAHHLGVPNRPGKQRKLEPKTEGKDKATLNDFFQEASPTFSLSNCQGVGTVWHRPSPGGQRDGEWRLSQLCAVCQVLSGR